VSRDAKVNDVGESVTAGAAVNELLARGRAVALAAPTLAVLIRTALSEAATITSLAAMIPSRRGLAPPSRFKQVVCFIIIPP
jgi:hypothetical protein